MLFGTELVTRTKFLPPRLPPFHLHRPHLYRLLDEARNVRLILIAAGTGYGKSTLLAGYLETARLPAPWYELAERDADPQVWAIHLAHLCDRFFPGAAERALHLLSWPGGAAQHGQVAIEALADALLERISKDTWLVLDDAHCLQGSPVTLALLNHLIRFLPPRLHMVIASRHPLELADLPRWRLRGEVFALQQKQLAFHEEELQELWQTLHEHPLAADQARRLLAETEGWPIAVQLLARRRPEHLAGEPTVGAPEELFDYLAREVLDRLDGLDRSFLLQTAPLRLLRSPACGALTGRADAARVLRRLGRQGVFLAALSRDVYRHHPLFREFLLHRLEQDGQLTVAYRAAARVLVGLGETEDAVDLHLAGGEKEEAGRLLSVLAPALVQQGRYARLVSWTKRLPADLLDRTPALALACGDAHRLVSRFAEAHAWYERARVGSGNSAEGVCRALAAQARVYLDTVQPARAEKLLEEALHLAPDAELRREIMLLLAENRINRGEARAAEPLLRQAVAESPGAIEHEARLRLRTGRLAEGRGLLRAALEGSASATGETKAHREEVLVLSLIEVLMGEPEEALQLAERGLERARHQQSPWTEAVALIRRGHARALAGETRPATEDYREVLALAGKLGVPRLKAEPLWGLALMAGSQGDPGQAERFAREGLDLAWEIGDGWMAALLALALGRAHALAEDARAESWLVQAQEGYERSGDTFGQALVALWSARLALERRESKAFSHRLRTLLDFIRSYDYGFLLTRPTLMGFPDSDSVRWFLTRAQDAGFPPVLLQPWLGQLGLMERMADRDPGVLCIRCLGHFRAWRGPHELGEKAWGRARARQLLHVFLAFRGQVLPKERLVDLLWPELDAEAGDRTFRVALNALNRALEPDRLPGQPTRLIVRRGNRYGLAGQEWIWLDVTAFEQLLDAARDLETTGQDPLELYRQALELYDGPFLADFTSYESWCERERERLAARYAAGVLSLIRLLASRRDHAGCADWGERLIAQDPCTEEAYRALMIARYQQGERTLAIRAYERCAAALRDELDAEPALETRALFERIRRQAALPDML